MYNQLTTGEKRSVTSSLKKVQDLFIEETKGDFLSYGTKSNYVNAIFSFWVDYSTKQKLSWCKDESRLESSEFKKEILKKIEELHAYEISVLQKVEKQMRSIRSKKKRIQKKRRKKILSVTH